MNVFELAKQCITRSLVENFFHAPGAYWRGSEFWTLNPLRPDSSVGSFSVNVDTGTYFDFSDQSKGDIISLTADTRHVSKKEAAELIAGERAHAVRNSISGAAPKRQTPPKHAIPFTPAAFRELNQLIKSDWIRDRFGVGVRGWRYFAAEGEVLQCVVRFEKNGKKQVIPFYFDGQRVHMGQAADRGRLLYNLQVITKYSTYKILISEGEKAAEAARLYLDDADLRMIATTWPGGCGAVSKADWTPLAGRRVWIWADNDDSGRKAVREIGRILTRLKCSIKIIDPPVAACRGWDAADAEIDGYSPWFVTQLLRKARPWMDKPCLADIAVNLGVSA